MNHAHVIYASARADFLERIRRYSFLFTLGFALYFGYLATVGRLTLRVGDTRGIYNSAWVGGLLAVVGSTFISLAGFYFVKNTIQRDRETRVGQILASTPLSRFSYILGKFASNFAVLSAMIGVLALSSFVMQLVSGEDTHIHLWPLLAPFLLFSLPSMAVIAAVGVLFETIPFLRGGFGNVAYFFLWTAFLGVPLANDSAAADITGLALLRHSLMTSASSGAVQAARSFSFSLDIGQIQPASSLFVWEGIHWSAEIVFGRLALFGVAIAVCAVAAALFDRFDTIRYGRERAAAVADSVVPSAAPGSAASTVNPAGLLTAMPVVRLTPVVRRPTFLPLLVAELRLLVKGRSWLWYIVAAGLAIAAGLVPDAGGRGMVLAFAWLWPILLWSSLGVREGLFQTSEIVFTAPHPIARQLPAAWLAGHILALVTGAGFALRLVAAGDMRGLAAWYIGALFIPSLALACGIWSRSSKLFEIVFTLLWYIGPLHAMPSMDFMGSAPATAHTVYPLYYLGLAVALFVAALAGRRQQLAR